MATLHKLVEEARHLSESQGRHAEGVKTLDAVISQGKKHILPLAFNHRGIMHRMLGQYEQAMNDYTTVLKYNPNNEQKAFSYCNMADIYRVAHSDFARAHSSLDEALSYADHNSLMHAKAVDQRGLIFTVQKQYESALISYERAKEITEKLLADEPENKDARNRYAQVLQHMSYIYLNADDPKLFDNAKPNLMSALEQFTILKDVTGVINTTNTLGKVAFKMKEYQTALDFYVQANRLAVSMKDLRASGTLNLDMAEAYLLLNRGKEAVEPMRVFADAVKKGFVTRHDLKVVMEQFKRVSKQTRKVPKLRPSVEKAKIYFRIAEQS